MRHHDHDHHESEAEHAHAGRTPELDPVTMKAVQQGRSEVVGHAGVLGLQRAAGNAATVDVDTYPGRDWAARVDSVSPATGAEFSVLPAQNSSGNWVKVVQRLPVRIDLDPAELRQHPLRVGLSMKAVIDTAQR